MREVGVGAYFKTFATYMVGAYSRFGAYIKSGKTVAVPNAFEITTVKNMFRFVSKEKVLH